MRNKSLSSIFLGVALAATLVLVAPSTSAKPPGLSKPTIIAVNVDTELAFMCGLPKSKVFFKYDSAKLLPGAKERLERIATCAKTGPAKGRALLVVGRTDPRGSDKYNEQLGKRRAESVAKYLRELGVAQTRVEIESRGEASAARAYPGGWPYDRRVTVRLQPSNGLAAPKKHTKMTDQQITSAVAHTLLTDSALLNKQIAARVDNGIVMLSGTADHLMARERAAKLAQTIRGVRGVVNRIALKTAWRSDDQIRKDVELALFYDAATDSYQVRPAVKNGVVTLRGTSQYYREKKLAVHIAKGVKGVKAVTDNITLAFPRSRSDAEIAAEVKRALSIDAWLAADVIKTKVKNGIVTLTGAVGSYALQDRALLLAWTAGVKSVNVIGLSIVPWARASGQRSNILATKSDSQIKQAVHDAFVYDPRVFSFNPGVKVKDSIVTLTGVVDNIKAKRAAEQDARDTVGVWSVKNLLKVRPAKPVADRKLAQAVISAFLRDPFLNSHAINVRAKNGVVTLTGSVASYFETTQAEDTASRANGVVNVNNNLTVSYPALVYYDLSYDPYWASHLPFYSYWSAYPRYYSWPRSSDTALKRNVEGELFWSPFVDSDHVAVNAKNGLVTLTGTVKNWAEYRAATKHAYVGGALYVSNALKVKY
jgi:osmotically-inducible protein OsmY